MISTEGHSSKGSSTSYFFLIPHYFCDGNIVEFLISEAAEKNKKRGPVEGLNFLEIQLFPRWFLGFVKQLP